MAGGRESPAATEALNASMRRCCATEPADAPATDRPAARRSTSSTSSPRRGGRGSSWPPASCPGVLWLVLFGGAVVTVGFTFFFGTENLRAQALMTGALSLLIFAGLLIIVAIDQPFAGTVRVGPEALAIVLADFGG